VTPIIFIKKIAVSKLGFGPVKKCTQMTFLAEPKPLFEPNICGEWLAFIGKLFWLSDLARIWLRLKHFGCEHFTAPVHNL
jgi:hypothetical protein